jgi:DNA-binding CsgD family transcriptional regulator
VHTRSARAAARPATVEEAVCDQAEAKWLAGRSADLPIRQAEVLSLRAQGFDLAQISQRTGLSYQAVRSLLARARRALRAVLEAALVLAVLAWRGRPRVVPEGAQTAALASVVVTLTVAGLALNAPSEEEPEEAPPSRLRPSVAHLPASPGLSPGYREPIPVLPDALEPALPRVSDVSGVVPSRLPDALEPALPSVSDVFAVVPSRLPDALEPALPRVPDVSDAVPSRPPDALEPALPRVPDVSDAVPSRPPVPPLDPLGPIGSIEPGRALATPLSDR